MARNITGYLFKRTNTWWVEYKVNGQRVQKSMETGDEREAKRRRDVEIAPLRMADEAEKARALATRAAGVDAELAVAIEAARPRLPLAKAWNKYLEARNRPQSGPHTLTDYERQWSRFTAWMAARYPDGCNLEDVAPEDAGAFLLSLETAGLGPNRYNKFLGALRLVFRILAPQCAGKPNPFAEAERKALDPEHRRALDYTELLKVCQSATGELRRLLALGMFCGFRVADACLLEWAEVNMAKGTIVRRPSKTRHTSGKAVAVPIHPELAGLLAETPASERRGFVLPGMASMYQRDNGAAVSKMIRNHFAGCGLADVNTRAALAERKEAGTPPTRLRAAPRVTFHSLRHTLITALAERGTPLAAVRELVGHSSDAVQRAYLHIGADTVRNAVAALPAMGMAGAAAEPEAEAMRREARQIVEAANSATLRRILALAKGK